MNRLQIINQIEPLKTGLLEAWVQREQLKDRSAVALQEATAEAPVEKKNYWSDWVMGRSSVRAADAWFPLLQVEYFLENAPPCKIVPIMTRSRRFPEVAALLHRYGKSGYDLASVSDFFLYAARDEREDFNKFRPMYPSNQVNDHLRGLRRSK